MAGPKQARGKQVASDIRGAFIRAARSLEDQGTPLSTLWEESLRNDFLGSMRALGTFIPKEMMLSTENEEGESVPFKVEVNFVEPDR